MGKPFDQKGHSIHPRGRNIYQIGVLLSCNIMLDISLNDLSVAVLWVLVHLLLCQRVVE